MDAAAVTVDEAYVISDLHLGGTAPFQIFREGQALAGFIDSLRPGVAGSGRRRALVINGDFVDFLAERPAKHFDPEGAVAKLERIARDPAFAPVFDALTRFIEATEHRLVIVLGNHDVELALSWVRLKLERLICGDDDARRGRVEWSMDGQGALLRIGSPTGPRVLCVHGNEVDAWNAVSHEDVRRISRDGLRQRLPPSGYIPNAGSRMVIEVMNGIKERYPFVDLLKPETEAVIPTLLALDPLAAAALRALPSLVTRQQADRLRIAAGFLGDHASPAVADAAPLGIDDGPAKGELIVNPRVPVPMRATARAAIGSALLDGAEEGFLANRHPLDLVGVSDRQRTLGVGGAIVALLATGDRREVLRAQLRDLAGDRSFSISDRDPTFVAMDDRVSTSIDYLVTGHTHLARAIERETRRAYYYNTGTWARVFRISEDALRRPESFAQLFDALGSNRIEALDSSPDLVAMRPHVAAIWADGSVVHGELREVQAASPYRAVPVDGTRFTRG